MLPSNIKHARLVQFLVTIIYINCYAECGSIKKSYIYLFKHLVPVDRLEALKVLKLIMYG